MIASCRVQPNAIIRERRVRNARSRCEGAILTRPLRCASFVTLGTQ